jgi:hypothetical protein
MDKEAREINQEIMDLIIKFAECFEIPPNAVLIDFKRAEKILFEDEINAKNFHEDRELEEFLAGKSYGSELKIYPIKSKGDILLVGLMGDKKFFDEIEKEEKENVPRHSLKRG